MKRPSKKRGQKTSVSKGVRLFHTPWVRFWNIVEGRESGRDPDLNRISVEKTRNIRSVKSATHPTKTRETSRNQRKESDAALEKRSAERRNSRAREVDRTRYLNLEEGKALLRAGLIQRQKKFFQRGTKLIGHPSAGG